MKKDRFLKKCIAWATLILQCLQPLYAAATAVVDKNAPAQNRPYVEMRADGMPIVQITTPSAAGVSRNVFRQFDVYSQGLILNNSRDMFKTQLAGYIAGNPYMLKSTARIILNEVTGPRASFLKGMTEVAGPMADVIIANPSGIVVNGAGFINTGRATLTTGKSVFAYDGRLSGFQVAAGQIVVEGAGLNASNLEQVDLISRATTVNAEIWANRLNVVAGANQVSYETTSPDRREANGNRPEVAIDIGALGGMYANKIYLVGTENGVGVNSRGTISAVGGDVTLQADGKITLAGNVAAKENIAIAVGADVSNTGMAYAGQNTSITAQGTVGNTGSWSTGRNLTITAASLDSTGVMGAGATNGGILGEAGDLFVHTSGTLRAVGHTAAAGNLTFTGANIDLKQGITYAGGDTYFSAAGNINNTGGSIRSMGSLYAAASRDIYNDWDERGQAGLMQAETILLRANNISNRSGMIAQSGTGTTHITAVNSINNTAGQITSRGDNVVISAGSLSNRDGGIEHTGAGVLAIKVAKNMVNAAGEINSHGTIGITAGSVNNNSGKIVADQSVDAEVRSSLSNVNGVVIGDAVQIAAPGSINNSSGILHSQGPLRLTTGLLSNQGGTIAAEGDVGIAVTAGLDSDDSSQIKSGRDLHITSDGNIVLAGSTLADRDIDVTAQNSIINRGLLYADGNTSVSAAASLINSGRVFAGEHTTLAARDMQSTGAIGAGVAGDGTLRAVGSLTAVASDTFVSSGQNIAAGNLTITGGSVNLNGSQTYAGRDAALTAVSSDISHAGGVMQIGNLLAARAAGTIDNGGSLAYAGGSIQAGQIILDANAIHNRGGNILQTDRQGTASAVAAGDFDNTGGRIAVNSDTLSLGANVLDNTGGYIEHAGSGQTAITTGQSLINQSGSLLSNGQISVSAGSLANSQGTIFSVGELAIRTGDLNNQAGILASKANTIATVDRTLTNQNGNIEAGGHLELQAADLSNAGGHISSLDQDTASIQVGQGLSNTGGFIGGNGDVDITAGTVNNNDGRMQAMGNLNVTARQEVDQTKGHLAAGQDVNVIRSDATLNNSQGQMSAGKNLSLQAAAIQNEQGTLAAKQNANVAFATMNGAGSLAADQDINLDVAGDFVNENGNLMKTSRYFNITATGAVTNKGDLEAGLDFTIAGNSVYNETGASISSQRILTVNAATDIVNNGRMGGNNLVLQAQTIRNSGKDAAIAATNNLNITAQAAVENQGEATLYSLGNININITGVADENGLIPQTGILRNQSGIIQAEKDITIRAQKVINEKQEFATEQKVIAADYHVDDYKFQSVGTGQNADLLNFVPWNGSPSVVPGNIISREQDTLTARWRGNGTNSYYNPLSGTQEQSKLYSLGEDVTELTIVKDSAPGKIIANNNMNLLTPETVNNMSWILASNTLLATGNVQNLSTLNNRTQTQYFAEMIPVLDDDGYRNTLIGINTQSTTQTLPGGVFAVFGGGRQVTIRGSNVTNGSEPSAAPEPKPTPVATGGLTVGNVAIGAGVQGIGSSAVSSALQNVAPTNGALLNFLSQTGQGAFSYPSNYSFDQAKPLLSATGTNFTYDKIPAITNFLIDKAGADPRIAINRQQDNFYAQRTVSDQITALTGRMALGGYTSDQQQYQTLLANGQQQAAGLQLTPGVALTAEQAASLNQDIVWMVEKEVNGQKVQEPVVYLARLSSNNLQPNGSIIAADTVNIAANQVNNTGGTIKASQNLTITADNVTNTNQGSLTGSASATIKAKETITSENASVSGNNVSLAAGRDITLAGTRIQAGNALTVAAGNNLTMTSTATEKETTQVDRQKKSQTSTHTQTTSNQTTTLQAGGNMNLSAGNDMTLSGVQAQAGGDMRVVAGNNLTTTAVKDKTVTEQQTSTKKNTTATRSEDETAIGTNLQAGGNLLVGAGQSVTLQGSQITGQADVTLIGQTGLTINAAAQTSTSESTDNKRHTTDSQTINQVSTVQSGKNLTLVTGGNLELTGAQLAAGETIQAVAQGDISLTDVTNDQRSETKKGKNQTSRRDETSIGTTLTAGGDIELTSGKDINLTGSNIVSQQGAVDLAADNQVTIQAAREEHETYSDSQKSKHGFLSKKTTVKKEYTLLDKAVGSSVSGETVTVKASSDLTVKGSDLVGTQDVSLLAGKDITITSEAEKGGTDYYKKTKKSGIFGGGFLGITIGSQSQKLSVTEKIVSEIGSTVGSAEGNVWVQAGNQLNSQGTSFITGQNLDLIGKGVSIDNSVNLYDRYTNYELKQSGLTISLGGAAVDAGKSLANDLSRAGEVQDERLQALYAYKAAQDLNTLGKERDSALSVNVSLGNSKESYQETTHTETVNPSNITAGGDVNIIATEDDLRLKATNINADNVALQAANNLNIESADNLSQTNSKSSASSGSVGASIGIGSGFNGITGGASGGKGKENQNITTHTESQIQAGGTVVLQSGNDTNILGSKVKGEQVIAEVGGNLNIASQQDSDTYNAKNQSAGVSFGTGKIGGTQGGKNSGKTNSDYESVTDQAGIYAGKEGFDITVGKNTDLKGAVISSEATPDKNRLSTDTLTYSDIENKAEYSASSKGYGYAAGKDANGKDVERKDLGLTPNLGVSASGEASSTTKSAISLGTIEIRSNPNQDLSNLSRTPEGTVNALGKIFDKQTVQEQQELAGLFGEEVFKAIGNLGLKEGSAEKVALDAFAGGLMAKLGGDSFVSGAAGAGFNQIVMNELKNIKDPAAMQWASMIVGAAAGKVVGGNAQTGASVAASETKNNVLSHLEAKEMEDELKNCKNGEERKAVLEKWGKLNKEREEIVEKLADEYEKAATDEEREAIKRRWDQLYADWGISDGIGVHLVIDDKIDKVIPNSRYEGLSKERQEILNKVDNATSSTDKLKYSMQFIGQGLVEQITNYRDSQYNLAINNGLSPELAGIAADNMTWNLIGPALSTALRTGNVLGSGLGNLFSKGPSNAGINIGRFTAQETSQLAATNAERVAAQEAAAAARNTGWVDGAGKINWPKNDGFVGTPKNVTIQPGARIDRYGYENGSYVSPQGTSYEMRALAPGTEAKPYNVYEVVKPIDALGGEIAPWFNQPGGGLQFKLGKTIQELLDGGYIRRVGS